MKNSPLVSVVLVNYNGKRFLNPCLSSIFSSTYQNIEVIIVDNASTDNSLLSIRPLFLKDKRLRILKNKTNTGPAGGLNMGIKHAKGVYIAILGYDTEIKKDCLAAYVEFMENNLDVGVTQGKLMRMQSKEYFQYAGDYLSPFGFLIERAKGAKDNGQFDFVTDIFAINSATMFTRKTLFDTLGGFDDDFFMYLEEADFCFRVHLYGMRVVFLPSAVVYHNHTVHTKSKEDFQFYKRNYLACRNYLLTLEKNLGKRNLLKILPLHIVSWLILALSLVLKGKFLHGLVIIKALLWQLGNIPLILRKRNQVQVSVRKVKDDHFKQLWISQPFSYYLNKAHAYTQAEMPKS